MTRHPPDKDPKFADPKFADPKFADSKLASFLHRHAPQPPPADPALRDEILAQLALHPHPRRRRYWRWALPVAIAAALSAGWLGSRQTLKTAELEAIETYLISSWGVATSVESDPFDDWLQEGDADFFDSF